MDKELYTFFGPFKKKRYNQFFNPNVCHVCKSPNNGNLIVCKGCSMISYCSEYHKILHLKSHLPVCIFITKALSSNPEWNTCLYINSKIWRASQKAFMHQIQAKIARELNLYEIEMFMCAKSCFRCHQQSDLRTCTTCYSVNYCNNHEKYLKTQHMSCCKKLLTLLNINILTVNSHIDNMYPTHMELYTFPNKSSFHNMRLFFTQYVWKNNSNQVRSDTREYLETEYYIHMDCVSSPLTLHYALQILYLKHLVRVGPKFVIHIIAGSTVDVMGLQAWELLLHVFYNIKNLHVIIIRPEIDFESSKRKLCKECCERRQKLHVQYISDNESYCDYVNMESYMKPNVIIKFQAELKEAWLESTTAILTQNCPFLFTVNSKHKSKEIMSKIEGVLHSVGRDKRLLLFLKNIYNSSRPYRNYETGGIFCRNTYIIMYTWI